MNEPKLPEALLGVFVTGGLSATLAASVGLSRAKALMLLGETFSAQQAQDWGLLWQVVAGDQLDDASAQLAARLAVLSPGVTGRFKHVLNTLGLPLFERAVALENETQRALSAQAGH